MRLRVFQPGQDTGQAFQLERDLITIGRSQDCDLVLPDTHASRRHAELRRFGNQWLLTDLGSNNGTFVAGTRLPPDEPCPLLPGVLVRIGGTQLVLEEEPRGAVGQGIRDRALQHSTSNLRPPTSKTQKLARALVAVGGLMLIVGSLLDWIGVGVNLPLVGSTINQKFSGLDSDQAWLFIGAALTALALLFADITAGKRGVGWAAGLGQALVAVVVVSIEAVSLYRYYRIGTQEILGVSLMDVMSELLGKRIHISIQIGLYLVAIGLAALIVGGLLRVLCAAREPA